MLVGKNTALRLLMDVKLDEAIKAMRRIDKQLSVRCK